MKALIFLTLVLSVVSCGKKGVVEDPGSIGIVDSLSAKKDFVVPKVVNEVTCIDDILKAELSEKDKVEEVLVDTDINYCNGLRVRLKVLKIEGDKKLRAYGFAESSSGKSSCVRDGSDFNKAPLQAKYEGTLNGDGIKISLGSHKYGKDSKLEKTSWLSSKYIKFEATSFDGELGFFENNELKCWSKN